MAPLAILPAILGVAASASMQGYQLSKGSPAVPDLPKAIAPDTKAVQQTVAEGAARRSRARGFRSTILSQNFLSPDNPGLKETYGS